jgi:hypothetical protein
MCVCLFVCLCVCVCERHKYTLTFDGTFFLYAELHWLVRPRKHCATKEGVVTLRRNGFPLFGFPRRLPQP